VFWKSERQAQKKNINKGEWHETFNETIVSILDPVLV
jgi:ribosomal protein S11